MSLYIIAREPKLAYRDRYVVEVVVVEATSKKQALVYSGIDTSGREFKQPTAELLKLSHHYLF